MHIVFAVAILIVATKLGPLAQVDRQPSVQWFCVAILLLMVATWRCVSRQVRTESWCSSGMQLLLVILILLLLFGGGGFYWGGPAYGGGGLVLVLLICLIIYMMGGFRRKL